MFVKGCQALKMNENKNAVFGCVFPIGKLNTAIEDVAKEQLK